MGNEPMPVFVFGCMSCGKTVDGHETSCPRCGASFEGVRFECPFCGEMVSPTQRKCEACGTVFGAFAEEVSKTSLVELDGSEIVMDEDSERPNASAAQDSVESMEFECPSCGKPVSENDTSCPHCGARFA
jgi:rubrerythrin